MFPTVGQILEAMRIKWRLSSPSFESLLRTPRVGIEPTTCLQTQACALNTQCLQNSVESGEWSVFLGWSIGSQVVSRYVRDTAKKVSNIIWSYGSLIVGSIPRPRPAGYAPPAAPRRRSIHSLHPRASGGSNFSGQISAKVCDFFLF